MLKTDYAGHERVYQRYKQEGGYSGWHRVEEVEAWLTEYWGRVLTYPTFPGGGRLLELGCGGGDAAIYFAQRGYEVVGVDIAPTAVEWAIANAAIAGIQAHFQVDDVLTLNSIADETFDIVLDGFCWHCIIGEDRSTFLHSAHRALKPGGIFCSITMCNTPPNTDYFKTYFDPETRCLIHDGIARRYIGRSNDMVMEVIQAGFTLLQMEIVPPSGENDLADLFIVAQKSFQSD